MDRVPNSDWSASTPWTGITGKPPGLGNPVDQSNVQWSGVSGSKLPLWNGTRFVPVAYSPSDTTTITPVRLPGVAMKRRPPGNPASEFQTVWDRYEANVVLFGATGDGGTDNSNAVNQAIAAINGAGGGSLYFPAGRYVINSQPNEIASTCTIRGDGKGVSTVIFPSVNGFTFYFGTSYLQGCVRDLSIEQARDPISATGADFSLLNLSVSFYGTGVNLTDVRGGSISECQFLSSGTAWAIYGAANDFRISDSSAISTAANGYQSAIRITSGTAISIHDCYIEKCSGSAISLGTSVLDCRIHDIAYRSIAGTSVVTSLTESNYVNELMGLGNNSDSRFDSRQEIYSIVNWNPGSINPSQLKFGLFSMPGARLGDQITYGAPYTILPQVLIDARVYSAGTAMLTAFNAGTSTILLDSGQWPLRVVN